METDAPKKRRENRWVQFVKQYSEDNNMRYHEALRNVNCRNQYRMNKIINLRKNASSVEYENPYNKNKKTSKWYKRLFSCVSI